MVRVRPVLAVGFIGALMAGGEFDGVEDRLEDVERRLEATGDHAGAWTLPEGMVAVDGGELLRLPVAMETYRAALALVPGDAPATIDHAQRAIHRAADEDDLTRAGASALMGLALWGGGDLEAAHRAYCLAAEGLRRTGYIADVLGCSITLADLRITQGRLREGLRTYEQALRLASDQDGTVLRGTADIHVGMSQIACERDDLSAATKHLRRAEELGEHTWLPQNPYRWRVAMARVRDAEGDLDGALDLLDEPSACTRVTSPRTCGRSRRCGPASWPRRVGWARPWPGRASRACRPPMTCPTCASSSTSPWPGRSWPSTGRSARSPPFTTRPGSCGACSGRPKRGSGPEASSRSWCCGRSPTTPAATSRARWRRWSAR